VKKHWLVLIAVLLGYLLPGCARLTGIDPSSLKQTTKRGHLVVKSDYAWEERFKLAPTQHLTLKAGTYKAYLDSRDGTYYEGGGACLETRIDPASATAALPAFTSTRCGVFVPNNASQRMLVYYYIDTERSQATMDQTRPGVIIEALDRAEWDNLKHLMYQPDAAELRSHIEISN
jgi:hypothetical protein